MRVEFSVSGDVQLNRDIQRTSRRARDMRPAFEQVIVMWRSVTKRQFATQGKNASGGWAPLAASTLREKRRRGQRPEILRATDALLKSLTDPGDPNELVRVKRDSLEYGTRLPYGAFHQRGTARMPQRRPVAFTESARRETIKIIQRYLITGEVR